MATERQTTGASPLLDIIREVWYTKRRMKYVLMDFTDTNSEDFEEYAQLTSWVLVDQYNKGYAAGYIDGWHVVFPEDEVDEDAYSDGYKEYPAPFEPSIPQYSTDTYIDNLVDIMRDNLRCRLLLKAALHTASNEFVTYPDLLEEGAETEYNTGYNLGYHTGLDRATDLSFGKPIIVHVRGSNYVQIIPNNQISGTTLYYWTGSSAERHEYTGEFFLDHSDIVYATNMLNGRIGPIASQYCDILDYSEINYATVRLPVGVASAKFSVEAVVYGNDNTIIPVGTYGGQYSYDKVNWYDIPITAQTGYPYQGLQQIKTFTLSGTNNEMYFRTKSIGNGCYALLFFDSTKEWIETEYETAPSGSEWAGETVYFVYSRDITNPTSIDIASNWSNCNVVKLRINSAQYAYAINDKLAGHTETKRGADINFETGDHSGLFAGCTGMDYICCLGWSDMMTTTDWVSNVAANGVFIKNPLVQWTSGTSGIPSGWSTYSHNMIGDSTLMMPAISQSGNTVTLTDTTVQEGAEAYQVMFYYSANDPTLRSNRYWWRDEWFVHKSVTYDITDNDTVYAFILYENGKVSNTTTYSAIYDPMTITQNLDKITITSDKGGTIYYYFDGDDDSPVLYNGTFKITESHTITAYVSGYAEHTTVCTWTGWENAPLTLEAIEDGVINGVNVSTGDYVDGRTGISINNTTARHNLKGSIASSEDWTGATYVYAKFTYDTKLVDASNCYVDIYQNGQQMFMGCTALTGAPQFPGGFDILFTNCYEEMFRDCTSLVNGPTILPLDRSTQGLVDTALGNYCYRRMFQGCTSLVNAPVLPASNYMTAECYAYMFMGCTSLVNAPDLLSISTNSSDCYKYMFKDCTSLSYIKCTATANYWLDCDYWTQNVSSTGTFVKAASATQWPSGESGIPTGWTVVNAA